MPHEIKHVSRTIEKIMAQWVKNGKKNFVVRVPNSHRIKEFELLLKQMLIHYQVPVKASVQEIPVEIKCRCGYHGEAGRSIINAMKATCPDCEKSAKVINGRSIEVSS